MKMALKKLDENRVYNEDQLYLMGNYLFTALTNNLKQFHNL